MTTNGLAEVFRSQDWYGYNLRSLRIHPDGKREAATIQWIEVKPGQRFPECGLIDLGDEGIQRLMDSLWVMGIRPSDRLDQSETVLAATKRHLEDMRNLVFKEKA